MDILTTQDLELLTQPRKGICVSLYLRTHTTGSDAQQGPISFSNMLAPVQQELAALGMSPLEARNFIRPARDLVSDQAFWQLQSQGVAVFLADGFFRPYRLPIVFKNTLVATERFHLKPLFPLLTENSEYFLLVISQSKIRLFQGNRFGLDKVIVPGVPEEIKDAVSQEQNEALQKYARRAVSRTADKSEARADENISRYFPQVNEGIQAILRDKDTPLLIAGVDYLLPLYRRVNTFPGLLPEEITGELDSLRAEALHEKAWPLVEPLFGKRRQMALDEFHALAQTNKTSISTPEIVAASYQGRVATLLLSGRKNEWGIVDRAKNGTVIRAGRQEEQGSEDLYEFAAVHTLLKGGNVFVAESGLLSAPIAAVLRD